MRINIVGWDNGSGLSRDMDILDSVLRGAGHAVSFNGLPRRHSPSLGWRAWRGATHGVHRLSAGWPLQKRAFDVNLFLESIVPKFLPIGALNCLLPHPECFRDEDAASLDSVDWVLCKTHDAETIFGALGCRTRFVGFTSIDRFDGTPRRYAERGFLHVAGSSMWKGTDALLELWMDHPEWPTLTVLQAPVRHGIPGPTPVYRAANLRHMVGRVSDGELRRHQNAIAVHLGPSVVEGFGHTIVESMSCAAVIVTTDAPPMNEHIGPGRGLLVRATDAGPIEQARKWRVEPTDFERRIEEVIKADPAELEVLGQAARLRYEENDAAFRRRLCAFLAENAPRRSRSPASA
jgi:hypothetical protein